jgi:hypothetical protein
MATSETVHSKALCLLQVIYERTHGREEPVFVEEIKNEIGLSGDDVKAAWRYLRDKQLIDTFNIEYTARINAYGVDAIEDARLHPDKPTQLFPSVTYNSITIQNSPGSAIQQGGSHAHMTQSVSYNHEDLDDLRRLVEVFEKHVDDLALDAAAKRKATAQVATIKEQLDDEPDPVIVRQAGHTLRNITEGVISGLIATAVQPTLWAWVATIMRKFF